MFIGDDVYREGIVFTTHAQNNTAPIGAVKNLVQTRNRYAFLTGRQDFNRDEIKRHNAPFNRFGIKNAVLIDDLSLANRPPPEKPFLRAVRALYGLPQKSELLKNQCEPLNFSRAPLG